MKCEKKLHNSIARVLNKGWRYSHFWRDESNFFSVKFGFNRIQGVDSHIDRRRPIRTRFSMDFYTFESSSAGEITKFAPRELEYIRNILFAYGARQKFLLEFLSSKKRCDRDFAEGFIISIDGV